MADFEHLDTETRQARMEEAEKILQRAKHRGIWIGTQQDVLGVAPIEQVSEEFFKEIANFRNELRKLVEDRRLDGWTDSRLVVFLDPLTADVFSDSEKCFHYERGDFELLEADMAESLVTLGVCAFHPGPEET